jgi:hypothetical protein
MSNDNFVRLTPGNIRGLNFDLQRFNDGDSNDNGSGDKGTQDFYEVKDPHTGDMVKVPKSLENFVNHLVSGTRGTVKKEVSQKYDELMSEVQTKLREKETENKDILEKLGELEKQNMSAEEIAKAEFKRNIDDMTNKLKTTETDRDYWKEQFHFLRTRNDIRRSFGTTKLCNNEEVVDLLCNEGNARLREIINDAGEKTGKYETILSLNIADKDGNKTAMEGTPDQLFNKWIEQDSKAHHLLINLNSGGGSRKPNSNGSDVDEAALKNMNPIEKLKYARKST